MSDGNSSFLRAARDGNLSEVLEYLKGSTDINTSNSNGLNALHLASKEGHINIVTELLRRGANVEAATKKGNTALHIASLAGHEEIVKILVQNGAKVNVQSMTGFTPLYMAAQEGHSEVVKFLLDNGASQSLATVDGFTPLAVALQQGHDKVVAVLLEHDTKGKVRLPALHIAAKKDDIGSANLLLQNDHNADSTTKSGGLVNDTTKSGFTPLHIAAHYGNVNVGTLLIQRGADVNYKAKNNITPLHVASRWGKSNMVTLLLDHEAVIEERTRDGLTPLHCAARSGHENVVDLLLERGAPFSAKTKNGLTPLHMAAQGDHVDCARLLLYHKAPVDDVTVDYLTPLHVAAHCGNVKTAKLLLDRKSDPNARALNGFTPLHIACKKNRIKVVELLLKYGASIEATTESGLTPLHVASFMGHMNISIYLIQHNANPDYPTVRGETALHLAARANQTDIIRILLRNGATVDAKAREQQTPLHIAARLGNVDNVVLLLQHGASPNATTKDLYTPLHIAAKEGHEEVAAALLDQGADHSLTTKKGFTPLHIAAKYGNIKVARLLLLKDADPDVQGKNGLTPLHVATHYNHVNVALLLLDNKASPHAVAKNGYTPLHIAAKKNQMDIATTLLEFGAKPNAESKNGFTPLHLASQEGHTDMVSLLLEHNANVNAQASNGLAPIHLAAQEDKVNVAEVLVKFGSEIDPQTKAGYTPLHTACHFGQTNMVRFLLDHNASVSSTTKLGYTPLHQAAQQGHVMVINLLLKNKASPNAVTNNGQTALSIAQRLGYISVVDTLKTITEVTETLPTSEDKYKVVAPETMQETMLSDSEDEGEDSISIEKGDITSPLDLSFDKDLHKVRNASEENRGRIISDIGAGMEYPTYLEKGPDYEAEMMYYSGDILSPQEKKGDLFGEDIYARGSFRYGRGSMPSYREPLVNSEVSMPVESVVYQGELTGSIATDTGSDYKFPPDDSIPISMKQQDYLDHQVMSHTFASHPENRYLNNTMDNSRYSSYSGSSFNTSFDPDNVAVDRTPTYSGFLVSFMVDARGGAMRGSRHSGVRIIIPPRKAYMPTRVTCKLIKREKLSHPPPLNEGEALASRILEMGPVGVKFLGPVIIEVPHFASLRGKEREIVIIRCDDGEKWTEHPMQATEEAVNETLNGSFEELDQEEELTAKRITRILTTDFPMYFAIVTRIRQENQTIGSEGGMLSSTVVPQVQTIFPEGALTKKIPVGLQAQPIAPELVAKMLGNRVAVSPIVTVEPRRRKFHKPITLTIPVPRAAQKGMINQYGGDAPTLRLLCSISGKRGTTPAVWEDITASTQLTFVNDCVSFTTTVSARFWLMDCQNVNEASRMATELYQEAVVVPFMAKFVIFAKRHAQEEGRLRMFCMTDDKVDKTLEKQEKFIEVARSRDVEVLQGRPQYVEMAGNLIPVTKSGDQLYVHFRAFRENRLPCTVKVRDLDQEPAARVAFMKEPKVARGEAPQSPICNLNIVLPDVSKSDSMEMTSEEALEVRKRHSLLREHGIVLQDTISRAQMKITDVADTLQGDWVMLAQQLDITMSEINKIKTEYNTVNDQALAMLHLWVEKNGDKASGNALEKALIRISREDVAKKCMYDVVTFEDEMEMAAGRVAMDQSGFDTFKEEVGISRDSSMKRGLSLDVSYDEQDMIKDKYLTKESESAEESGSDADTEKHRLAKGEHVSERSELETKERLTEELVDSQHTPRETAISAATKGSSDMPTIMITEDSSSPYRDDDDDYKSFLGLQNEATTQEGQIPATSDLSQEHEADSGVDRSEMTMEEHFEQTTRDERKPVAEPLMLEEDSASTEPALMSSSQSRDNNTYSSISSSDFGEQVASLQSQQLTTQEVLSEEQALTEEDFQRMMSSYENVYDGVQLTPDVNRLSMNASELDIGDHFDTKQLDTHLQPTGRSSSFEQLYQEETGERPTEEKLAELSTYPVKPKEDLPSGEQIVSKEVTAADEEKAEKLSSSSSEVAQVEDVDFQPDAEMRDTSEEKTEETDVEEQFSPLPKTSPASKGALDLRLEDQYFSFTQSPVESPAAEIANEISPAQDLLDVKDMQITVGVSPSEISARAKLGHVSEFFGPTVSDDTRPTKGKYEKEKEDVLYVSKIETEAKKMETDTNEVAKTSSESYKAAVATKDDKEDMAEQLTYMAFDDMGFAGEEAVDSELKLRSCDLPEESPHSKSKEISPEDLEEKPHHFDFPDVQQEMWQIGIQAFGKSALSEERKTFSSSMKFEEVTHKVSFEKDDEDESSTAVYSESEEPSQSENGDLKSQSSFQESVEISKTVDGHFESTSEVRTEKTVVTSSKEQVSLSESHSKMYSETKVYHHMTGAESDVQPSEIQTVPFSDKEKKRPLSTVVSEPIISHPFDHSTVELMSPEYSSSDSEGFYDPETGKKLPWETVNHFKRQFSDNFLEQQEKQGLVTVQSVDMGIFYRRSSREYADVKFMEKGIAEDEIMEEQAEQVVFTLDENDSDESAALPSQRKEDEVVDDSTEDIKKPHDKVFEEQRATVLPSSTDSRNRAEEDLSKLHEEMSPEFGASEFLSTSKSSELVERGASKDSSLHLVGDSSTDSSQKQSIKEAEERSTPSEELDIKEELKESAKSGIIGVVSVESRRAQKELLQESADETDRSLSPTVESDEMSTMYECQAEDAWSETPSVDQLPSSASGKSETESEPSERKPSEKKQSPSVEALAKGTDLESTEQEESKITAHDRRVTFLSEESKEKLRQSISNEDLVKISTSSSEVSNEPTLLAASYDLDSGHVSHVVTAYDMSPDTVESQAPHPPAPKAILSGPEDDVFEVEPSVRVTGAAAESHSGPQSEVIIIEHTCAAESKTGSESTESLPPTPAPTPKDPTAVKDTVCNLQDAANKLQTEGYYDRQLGSVSSETSEKRPLSFEKELTKDEDSIDDDDLGQSFEMVSPTEIIGFDQFAAEYLQSGVAGSIEPGSMAASMESISTSGSSFADLRPSEPSSMKSSLEESVTTAAFIEPSAPPMEDVYQPTGRQSSKPDVDSSSDQSLFSSSETSEKGGVPVDILASSLTSPGACPPDLLPVDSIHHGLPTRHEYGETEEQENYSERISQLPNGPTEVDYQPDIDSVSSLANTVVHVAPPDLVQTTPLYTRDQSQDGEEGELEDDRISVGSDAASRDVMTDSLIEDVHLSAEQQEILVTSDQTLYELEMPMDEEVSPVEQECTPGETETYFEQKPTLSKEMKHEEEEELDGRVRDSAKAIDKQIYDDMSLSSPEHLEIESSLDDIEDQPYELKKNEIYPGKRALEFNIANYENLVEEEKAKQEELDSNVTVMVPLHFSSKLESTTSDIDDSDEEPVQFADQYHSADLDSSKYVSQQEYGTSFNRIDIIEDSPEFAEKPEAELQALTEDERISGKFFDSPKEENIETKEKPFDLQVDPADLERPTSPTPQDLNQGFFGKDFEKGVDTQDGDLEKTASVFVDSVLEDIVTKVHDKPGSLELGQKSKDRDAFQSSLPEPSTSSHSQPAFFSAPPPPSHPPPVAKQGSEDLPEITVTEHLHKDIHEDDYPMHYAVSHRKASVEVEKDDDKESEDDSPKGVGMSYFEMIQDEMEFDQEDAKQNGDTTHQDASGMYGFSETSRNGASHQDPITGASFSSVSAYTEDQAASSSAEIFTSQQETVWNVQKYSESSTDLSPKTSPQHDSFTIKSDLGSMSTSHSRHIESSTDPKDHSKNGFLGFDPAMYVTDIMSPEDVADASSVDSFTTVVAADQEEEDDEDRLADVASMTSSIHSDIYSMHNEPDDEEEEPYDWPLMTEEDRSGESSPCSDRFEMIEKTALSVISEKSDEDRFEMIEKDELDGLSDLHSDKTSPDMISASPGNISHSHHGYPNIRYAGRMREKEDGSAASSVSSSLLEFERLEGEIGQCGSLGSNEAHSLPSSFDSRKFHWRAGDRDDVSVASSLGEFERLERQIALGGSIGSVGSMDRFMASGHGSGTNGSMSSLAEFEKLEQDCIAGGYSSSGDDRRSSSSGHSKRSESSSLVEFERLEQEIVISEELAAEAKKIASILESGALPEYPESDSLGSSYQSNGHMRDLPQIIGSFDIEQDSIDGEDIDKDSLSSEDPKQSDANLLDKLDDDVDSLDGDSKDELTSSVIYVSKSDVQDSGEAGQTEFDRDSLIGDDTAMQFSVESLQLDQDTSFDTHSMQSSADSLELKEKLSKDMQSSADSLELKEKMSKEMVDSTDSLELKETVKDPEKFETDSLADPEDVMQTSADSLDMFPALTQQNIMEASLESARWSLGSSYFSHSSQETLRSAESHSDSGHSRDMMQVSAESFDFEKDRPYDDSDNEIDYKSISTKSLAHSTIDPEIRMLTEISHPNNPFLDNEGNVRTDLGFSGYGTKFDYSKFDKEGNYRWSTEFDESTTKSKSYLNWGPYQEKKKIYTMTEWEAMRKAKKRPADTESEENNEEQTSILPDNHSSHSNKEISSNLSSEHIISPSETSSASHHPRSASSSSSSSLPAAATCPVSSSTSQTAASSDPLHHHSMLDTTAHKASRESPDPMNIQEEASHMKPEEREGIDVTADSETDDGSQATSLMMKKEIHKKTYIRDGRDETFIQEESRVEQQNETPEELRESMQQIIDQFMQTPSDFDQRQCLEDDV